MTWIALDCDLPDHPKMVDLPNDSARYGWIVTLSKAKRQRNAGRFANAKHFAHVLGKYGKFVEAYVKAGLLDKADDGSLTIHDWRQHQWASSKAKAREDGDETPSGPNVDTGETFDGHSDDSRGRSVVPVPVSVDVDIPGVGSGAGGSDDPEWPVLIWLTQHKATIPPNGSGLHRKVIRLVDKHGVQKVIRTMAELGDDLEPGQYVLGADNALNPIPSASRETAEQRKQREIDEARAEAQRRMAIQ